MNEKTKQIRQKENHRGEKESIHSSAISKKDLEPQIKTKTTQYEVGIKHFIPYAQLTRENIEAFSSRIHRIRKS
ncbi:MAG: hypothetical protein CO032_00160 [Nitrosopumilales archaeon CG_4_9_14_0_2_um_filter_34_16]|nr:MAG: hypothetical protein CO032_00160 [Nitrosopumilales archaeon CG_4_9_14_0_2_um_filter_34_16]